MLVDFWDYICQIWLTVQLFVAWDSFLYFGDRNLWFCLRTYPWPQVDPSREEVVVDCTFSKEDKMEAGLGDTPHSVVQSCQVVLIFSNHGIL